MYCDFNEKLFEPFTSMKTKIKPGLASDWEIIPASYNTSAGFILSSKKINQKVADIDLRRFLKFSKINNLTIKGLKLEGTYCIGNDRAIYTEEMYNTWYTKFKSRTEIVTAKKDLKVGYCYATPCGSTVIYLGFKYMSRLKGYNPESLLNSSSKIKKVHYSVNADFDEKDFYKYNISNSYKFSRCLGEALSINECDKVLNDFYNKDVDITYFSDTMLKNPVYGVIDMPTEIKNEYNIRPIEPLLKRTSNGLFLDYLHYDKSVISINESHPYNEVSDKSIYSGCYSFYSNRRDYKPVLSFHRIGVV